MKKQDAVASGIAENKECGAITKLDILNMEVCSESLQDHVGESFKIKAMCIRQGIDQKTGEEIVKGFIVTQDGIYLGTISQTAIRSIYAAIDAYEEVGGDMSVNITLGKSKSDREFIKLFFV